MRASSEEIGEAFESLLKNPRVVSRPTSRQWTFLRACFTRLVGPPTAEVRIERRQAAQYRFEIEARLKEYYQSAGLAPIFIFSLVDHASALRQKHIEEDYPATAGYALLVSHARSEIVAPRPEHELREYFIRLVEDATRAELAAYRALPTIDLSLLDGIFVRDGSAYRRIQNVLEQQSRKQETIRHPEYNPSTMRVLSIRVAETSDAAATVYTQEYWYLRWWSLAESRYVYVYNETNRQRYLLARVDGQWLVDGNIYPPPRATTAMRRPRTRGTQL